jgi:hypothetical protein
MLVGAERDLLLSKDGYECGSRRELCRDCPGPSVEEHEGKLKCADQWGNTIGGTDRQPPLIQVSSALNSPAGEDVPLRSRQLEVIELGCFIPFQQA